LVTAEDDDNNSPDINGSEDYSIINSDNNVNELPDELVTEEDPEETIDPVTTTRSGRASKPFDYESNYPGIYMINYADNYISVNGGQMYNFNYIVRHWIGWNSHRMKYLIWCTRRNK